MHVLRPLFVFAGVVIVALAVRSFVLPASFGIHGDDYIYGWYNQANLSTWQEAPVKFKGREYCQSCHADEFKQVTTSLHAAIQCEDCHGPAANHPSDPPKLTINRSRALCLRCHADLPATLSARAGIKGQDPDTHNPGLDCVTCHRPHSPKPGGPN